MRTLGGVVVVALVAVVWACAPKVVPAPVVTSPKYPDFITPSVPPELAGSGAAYFQGRAWSFLQAGDLLNAEREVALARRAAPAFYPAETTAGYLALARQAAGEALGHFDRALERNGGYAAALAGRGEALVALNREPEALPAFETALASDPSLGDLRRRVEVLRFRGVERELAMAREAAGSGRLDDSVRAYQAAIARSPTSPFLYRELAGVERLLGDTDRALEHFRQAVTLDPGDAGSLLDVARLLDARGDLQGALRAYDESLAIEYARSAEADRDLLRDRIERLSLPAEYRSIETAPQTTRADLAALIGVRLGRLLQAMGSQGVVLTDVRQNWAEAWIIAVATAGVMEAYANHTFQPQGVVRRADLAEVVVRLLPRVAAPAGSRSGRNAPGQFSDLSTGHLAYPAASAAVAAGVMAVEPDGSFQPARPVTGAEAVAAIGQLKVLADAAVDPDAGRR